MWRYYKIMAAYYKIMAGYYKIMAAFIADLMILFGHIAWSFSIMNIIEMNVK